MTIPERTWTAAIATWTNASTVALRGDAVRIIAGALLAAEQRGAAREIVVKPLDWRNEPVGSRYELASTTIGRYAISEYAGMEFPFKLDAPGFIIEKYYSTKQLAKEAAQADYDARIRAAVAIRSLSREDER